jgi:hypothetical protein
MSDGRRSRGAGRGRFATLPPKEGAPQRPGIATDGLSLTIWDEDGVSHRVESFNDSPGAVTLRQQWVKAIAAASGPLGTWKSLNTSIGKVSQARVFLPWAADNGILSLDDLIGDDWIAFQDHIRSVMAHTGPDSRNTILSSVKAVLLQHPNRSLRRALSRRWMETGSGSTREHYSVQELQQIRSAALKALRVAWERIEPNWLLVTTPKDAVPEDQMERWQALHEVLANPRERRPSKRLARILGAWRAGRQASATRLRETLFLNADEGVAAIVAIIGYNGENLSTTLRRKVPSTGATAGSEVAVLTTERVKRRRGTQALMVENVLEDSDLGRVLALIRKVTEPARFAAQRNPQLFEVPNGTRTEQRATSHENLILFANGAGSFLNAPALMPASPPWMPEGLRLSCQKLHRSYITRIAQAPTDHRERTFIEAYILKDAERIQELEDIHRDAQRQAFNLVQQVAIQLMTREEALEQGLDTQGTPKGTRCRDIEHHPSTGKACDRGWLACLTCANAYIVTDNLPPIVALHDLLAAVERDGDDRDRFRRQYLTPLTQLRAVLADAGEHAVATARAAITPELNSQVWQKVIRERGQA